jgi:hypothetical protein
MSGSRRATVTIADGGTESTAFETYGAERLGVILPSTFDGTTLGIKVAEKWGGTYATLNDDSGAVSLTVAAGGAYVLPDAVRAFPAFKLVAGAQTGATAIFVLAAG